MVVEDDRPSPSELERREPTVEDLRDLCRELNRRIDHDPIRVKESSGQAGK